MDTSKIKESLRPWVQIETWHTGHPLDSQRFHNALSDVFELFGTQVSFNDFEEALTELVDEIYPNWEEEHKEKTIHKYSLRAENIGSYLSDTQ